GRQIGLSTTSSGGIGSLPNQVWERARGAFGRGLLLEDRHQVRDLSRRRRGMAAREAADDTDLSSTSFWGLGSLPNQVRERARGVFVRQILPEASQQGRDVSRRRRGMAADGGAVVDSRSWPSRIPFLLASERSA